MVGQITLDLASYISTSGATVQFAASEITARFPIGNKDKDTFGVRLKQLKNLFTGGSIKGYWYAANQSFGISLKSPDSLAITLANALDNVNAQGGVNVIDVSTQFGAGDGNILFNGDMLYSTSGIGGTTLQNWNRAFTGAGSFTHNLGWICSMGYVEPLY